MTGKRVGLLGVLLVLVLVLGSGVEGQSPTPGATPPYAPIDLASAIPSQVGDVALDVRSWTGPELLAAADDTDRTAMTAMLTSLGKEPEDLTVATAEPFDESAPDTYWVTATRVVGVPADTLMDAMQQAALSRHDRTLPENVLRINLPVAGRTIYPSYNRYTGQSFNFFYLRGEVLFRVEGYGDVTVEDVLAVLP